MLFIVLLKTVNHSLIQIKLKTFRILALGLGLGITGLNLFIVLFMVFHHWNLKEASFVMSVFKLKHRSITN